MTAKPGTTNEWLEDIAVELHGVNERLLALTDAIRERRDAPASTESEAVEANESVMDELTRLLQANDPEEATP